MKVKFHLLKFVLVAITFLTATMETNSQIKTSFTESDFTIRTNNLAPTGHPLGYHYYGSNTNRFRLVNGHTSQSTVLWFNEPLDLTKNFILDMKLKIGNDGIVFAIRRGYTPGPGASWFGQRKYLGYGDQCPCVSNSPPFPDSTQSYPLGAPVHTYDSAMSWKLWGSFAVKFDTHYDAACDIMQADHISHLKHGCMNPIGNAVPIRPNGASVKGENLCVRITWEKTTWAYQDAYVLRTYVQDGDTMSLRIQQVFSSIDDLVDTTWPSGIFYWGITSGSAQIYPNINNVHEVEFVRFENNDSINFNLNGYILDSTRYMITILSYGFRHLRLVDSVRIMKPCGEIYSIPSSTKTTLNYPIQYPEGTPLERIVCLSSFAFRDFHLKAVFPEINSKLKARKWSYLEDGVYVPLKPITYIDSGGFFGSDYTIDSLGLDSLLRAKSASSDNYIDTFVVRLIAGTDTLIINIGYYNENYLSNYLKNNLSENMNLSVGKTADTLNLTVQPDSLEQNIKLPLLDSCNYSFGSIDSSKFASFPEIVGLPDSAVLHFKLKDSCGFNVSLEISLDCECIKPIVLNAFVDCEEEDTNKIDCEGVEISIEDNVKLCYDLISGLMQINDTLHSFSMISYSYPSNKTVQSVVATI